MWVFLLIDYIIIGYFVTLFYFIAHRKEVKSWDTKQQIVNFIVYWVGFPILVGYLFIKYTIKIFVLDF